MRLISTEQELLETLPSLTGTLYLDTETTGLDPYSCEFLLLQIATDEEAFVYDYTKLPISTLKHFESVLSSGSVKVIHNATFDLKILYHFAKFVVGPVHDTMVAEAMLNAGISIRNSLAIVAKERLGETLDKSVRDQFTKDFTQLTQEQIEYALKDVLVLRPLYQIHQDLIDQHNIRKVYEMEMQLVKVVALMEYHGMPFDRNHLLKIEPMLESLIASAEKAVQRMVIEQGKAEQIVFSKDGYKAVNPSSNQQMLAFFNSIGIDIPDLNARTVTEWDFRNRKSAGKFELPPELFDEELLESIDAYGRYENQQLRTFAYLVGARKLQSTYVKGLQRDENPKTNRIHCTFRQVGAATGRFSSSNPNLQNLPSDQKMKDLGLTESIRHAFAVANDNRRLIIADYSTIELVIIADGSNDENLITNLEDLHTYVAKEVMGVADINNSNKKEHPYKIWRDVAKMVNYSIAYSVGGQSLSKQMTIKLAPLGAKVDTKQADLYIEHWKKLFPMATEWLKKSSRSVVVNGFVADSYGRKRWWNTKEFHVRWKREAAEREGANFPIQALSATMVKLALIKAYERLDYKRAIIVSTVHDEIILESTVKYAETARLILKEAMEEAAREVLPNLGSTVVVDPAISMRYDK